MNVNMNNQQKLNFGKYQEIRRIGTGGFGKVYLVMDDVEKQWALKQVYESIIKGDPEEFRRRFEREAYILESLNHPNIIKIHDVDLQAGYIVMEYANAGTLRKHREEEYRHGMSPHKVLEILQPIGRALAYSHRTPDPKDPEHRGSIHLDITTMNILLHDTGTERRYILSDFGLAHWLDQIGRTHGGKSLSSAANWYMSPEQSDPSQYDRISTRSDIYALGIVLGEMLTGQHPADVPTEILRETNSTLPSAIQQVLKQAIDRDPKQRHASVEDLTTDFTQAVAKTDSVEMAY